MRTCLGIAFCLAPMLLCQITAGQALTGTWTAGATTMNVRVESWGPDCGPEPKSSRTEGGGQVQISEAGQELVIHGRDRDIRTDRCWSENPAMRRRSSHVQDGKWVLQCQTPKDDPREESGSYTLTSSGGTEVRYRDESRYNWQLRDSRCVATIVTTQVLQRSLPEGTAKQSQTAPATAACKAGAATHLVLRPAQAEIEVGEEFCVRAVASDASGCTLANPPIRYSLEHAPGLQGSLERPCFRSSTTDGEGSFTIVATLGRLRAESTVLVASMDLSALIAKRLDVGAVTGFEAPSPNAQAPTHEPTAAARPRAKPPTQSGKATPVAVGLGLVSGLALFLLGTLALYRRKRRSQKTGRTLGSADQATKPPTLEPESAAAPPSPESAAAPPSNASDGTAWGTKTQSVDRTNPGATDGSPSHETWICPNCRHGFPAVFLNCPKCSGGVRLVPYREFVAATGKNAGQKWCADCGAQCSSTAQFCGECGGARLEIQPR